LKSEVGAKQTTEVFAQLGDGMTRTDRTYSLTLLKEKLPRHPHYNTLAISASDYQIQIRGFYLIVYIRQRLGRRTLCTTHRI
jgi:hypothetical protein